MEVRCIGQRSRIFGYRNHRLGLKEKSDRNLKFDIKKHIFGIVYNI